MKNIEREPLGQVLLKQTPDMIIEFIGECIPFFGGKVKGILETIFKIIRERNKK